MNEIGMFKAYRVHRDDGKITAQFEDLSLNQLSPGDVVIEAHYSGINYKDALAATGAGRIMKSFPLVGGVDVAGVVVISENPNVLVGQRVVVTGCGLGEERDGGYAQYVRVDAASVIALPDTMSTWDAMCLGTAGFTAALAIARLEHQGLTPESGKVIVTGATGGVGSLAINMLAGIGYHVVALTSKVDAADYLTSIGAHEVLLRSELNLRDRPLEKAQWAAAVDNVGGDILAWLTQTTDWWGSIASIGLAGGHQLNTTVMPFILRGISLLGVNSVHTPRPQRLAVWQRLATDLRPKALTSIGENTAPFEALPTLFQQYLDGTVVGRTVIEFPGQS